MELCAEVDELQLCGKSYSNELVVFARLPYTYTGCPTFLQG